MRHSTSHRLLSAAPAVAAAYLAIWATAFQTRAAKAYNGFSELLTSDARVLWLCVALITAYAALWWWTSLEPKSRRAHIQEGLRLHYKQLSGQLSVIRDANSYEEVSEVRDEMNSTLQKTGNWLLDNMSQAAFEKFKNPKVNAVNFSWPGQHERAEHEGRTNLLAINYERLEVLDTFLRYDGWDGEEPNPWQRIKRWMKRKNALTTLEGNGPDYGDS